MSRMKKILSMASPKAETIVNDDLLIFCLCHLAVLAAVTHTLTLWRHVLKIFNQVNSTANFLGQMTFVLYLNQSTSDSFLIYEYEAQQRAD